MKTINWTDHFFNFLAVILGVLLAFQIGSWSETKKSDNERIEIIQSFIKELEEDQTNFSGYQIPLNEKQSATIGSLLENILTNQLDSVENQLGVTLEVQNVNPVSTTYNSVISSGKLGLIGDFEIKKRLSGYYDGLALEAIKTGELQVDFFLQELLPWIMQNVNLVQMDTQSLGGNSELTNRLIIYRSLVDNKTEKYRHIDEAAKALSEDLKSLLDE